MIRERGREDDRDMGRGEEGERERGKMELKPHIHAWCPLKGDQWNKAADTPLLAGLCQWTLVTHSLTFAPSFSSRVAAREMYSLNLNRSNSRVS